MVNNATQRVAERVTQKSAAKIVKADIGRIPRSNENEKKATRMKRPSPALHRMRLQQPPRMNAIDVAHEGRMD